MHVRLTVSEIWRILGMEFTAEQAAALLRRGGFSVTVDGDALEIDVPDSRLDISDDPVTGAADIIEEIARINGYDTIPQTVIADMTPPQWVNVDLEREEFTRDTLVALGLREQISYRLTTPAREALLTPPGMESSLPNAGYVELSNPISSDKTVMRRTLLISLLDNARANARYQTRQAVFEIGAVYLQGDAPLPDEPRRLGILLMGTRQAGNWQDRAAEQVDFYDLKGVIEGLLAGLHVHGFAFERARHTSFHPGRSAALVIDGQMIGTFGELHPLVTANFELEGPVFAAEIALDPLLKQVNALHTIQALPLTPPVLQDIALVVSEATTAAQVEDVIRKGGGDLLKGVRLFDVYTGDPIPAGHKSLAYSLTYQTDDRTLTDKEVAKVHERIVRFCERELGAKLRA